MLKSFRRIQFFIVILICLGLFSTGFAAWNITDQIKHSVESSGSILADSTEYISKYIHLSSDLPNKKALTFFDFTQGGFTGPLSDGVDGIKNIAYVKAYYEININECRNNFVSSKPLIAEFTLKYKTSIGNNKSIFDPNLANITLQLASGNQIDGSVQAGVDTFVPTISTNLGNKDYCSFKVDLSSLLDTKYHNINILHCLLTFKIEIKGVTSSNRQELINICSSLRNNHVFTLSTKIDGSKKEDVNVQQI